VFDSLLNYLTALLEYIDLEWLSTANVWVGLCPARPILGYATDYEATNQVLNFMGKRHIISIVLSFLTSKYSAYIMIY